MTRFFAKLLLGLSAAMLTTASLAEDVTPTEHRGSYARNGRIHVGLFGHPDGPPLTTGHGDNWITGNQLYLYRLKDGSTTRISTDPNANHMYPHGEKTPK